MLKHYYLENLLQNYEITTTNSRDWKVYSKLSKKYIGTKLKTRHTGLRLRYDNRYYTFTLHHLLALLYIPKPFGEQLIVHHIDKDPTNNSLSNLIWLDKESHKSVHDIG